MGKRDERIAACALWLQHEERFTAALACPFTRIVQKIRAYAEDHDGLLCERCEACANDGRRDGWLQILSTFKMNMQNTSRTPTYQNSTELKEYVRILRNLQIKMLRRFRAFSTRVRRFPRIFRSICQPKRRCAGYVDAGWLDLAECAGHCRAQRPERWRSVLEFRTVAASPQPASHSCSWPRSSSPRPRARRRGLIT